MKPHRRLHNESGGTRERLITIFNYVSNSEENSFQCLQKTPSFKTESKETLLSALAHSKFE